MNACETTSIRGLKRCPDWQITFPYLKLALKYGLVGPWKGEFNRSVQFDAYSLCRGPTKGVPNGADLLITALMNSGINSRHLAWLEGWLGNDSNVQNIRELVESLRPFSGLQDMTNDAIDVLGDFVDHIICDKNNRDGSRGRRILGGSRLFKWLSAWACHHVPMIDNELHHALTRSKWPPNPECHHSSMLLNDYKELLVLHLDQLEALGKQLFTDLKGLVSKPISPVRVLDSLLWFDWIGCKRDEFNGVWFTYKNKGGHELLDAGKQFVYHRDTK